MTVIRNVIFKRGKQQLKTQLIWFFTEICCFFSFYIILGVIKFMQPEIKSYTSLFQKVCILWTNEPSKLVRPAMTAGGFRTIGGSLHSRMGQSLSWMDLIFVCGWKRAKWALVSSFEQVFADFWLEYVKAVVMGLCCFCYITSHRIVSFLLENHHSTVNPCD